MLISITNLCFWFFMTFDTSAWLYSRKNSITWNASRGLFESEISGVKLRDLLLA